MFSPARFGSTHGDCFSFQLLGLPLVGKCLICMSLAREGLQGEFSNPVLNDRWGPEALREAGGLKGQRHRWFVCFTLSLRAEPTVWDAHWLSGYPWGFAAQLPRSGSGACPRPELKSQARLAATRKESPGEPWRGLQSQPKRRGSKRSLLRLGKGSQVKCEEVSESPEETSGPFQSSICGKEPWRGAASSPAKID